MRFSVVIPMYNSAATVGRAIRSVLAQTWSDFELIVVNDGSKDEGADVVRGFDDPRIRLAEQPNQGVSVARNRGVEDAKSEWVAFLDADDEWRPTFLERVDAKLAEYPEAQVTFSNLYDTGMEKDRMPTDWPEGYVDDMFDMSLKNGGRSMVTSTVVVRKDVFEAAGRFTPGYRFGQDRELWVRLWSMAKVLYISESLAIYHSETPGSAMKQRIALARYSPKAAETIGEWDRAGKIPPRMVENARKLASLMYMVQAQRLIAIGDTKAARDVLKNQCQPIYCDPNQYARLLRMSYVPSLAITGAVRLRDALRRAKGSTKASTEG